MQYIDKVVDIPAEAAQQDTQHENKKRKTLFVSIASGDEAKDGTENESAMTQCLIQGEESMLMDETDAQGPKHEIVQVMHAERVQDLRDVKNELTQVRELVGIVVRRERSAKTKAEIAARRLDRMEQEQHEVADAVHEANLQEALSNQSKAVKVLVRVVDIIWLEWRQKLVVQMIFIPLIRKFRGSLLPNSWLKQGTKLSPSYEKWRRALGWAP